jgi:hypothetical protein
MATRISSANASTAPRANSHDRSPLVTPSQILDDWLDLGSVHHDEGKESAPWQADCSSA